MVNKNERFNSVFIQFLICAKRLDFNKMETPAHHLILWGGALPRGGGAGLSTGFKRTRASHRGVLHRGGTVERRARKGHMAQAVQLDPANHRAWHGLIAASEGYLDGVDRIRRGCRSTGEA